MRVYDNPLGVVWLVHATRSEDASRPNAVDEFGPYDREGTARQVAGRLIKGCRPYCETQVVKYELHEAKRYAWPEDE